LEDDAMNVELNTGDNNRSMSEILKDALMSKNISQRKFAKMMGWTPQNFGQRLKKGSFTAEEWNRMMNTLGYEVKLIELESGVEFESRKIGHGRRLRQVRNGIVYDTYKADALCSDFYSDGENEYTDGMAFELYVDSFRRCFVARYVEWDNGTDSISPIAKEEAKKLFQKYGDNLAIDTYFI